MLAEPPGFNELDSMCVDGYSVYSLVTVSEWSSREWYIANIACLKSEKVDQGEARRGGEAFARQRRE